MNDQFQLQLATATTPPLEALAYDLSRNKKIPAGVRTALSQLTRPSEMQNMLSLSDKLKQGGALSPQEQMFLDNYMKGNVSDLAMAGTARRVRKVPKESITSLIDIEKIINNVLGGNFRK